MQIQTLIKPSEYHDSVSLMLVAQELSRQPGVLDTAVVMATDANKGILKEAGLLTPEADAATPNDLVIAVRGEAEDLSAILETADRLLKQKQIETSTGEIKPKTLRSALRANPAANVAVISVSGRYAAGEAWEALQNGLHVLLFSDNVALDDEIALKKYASQHGLLLMGPGAGTAILNGVALGFANVVPSGPIGIVSAAGTGLQEVSTLLAKHGVGITQGIGTGGRDLKEEVGGIMMLDALKALQEDPLTQAIVLISKPPAAAVARKVLSQAALHPKPIVMCLLGADPAQSRHQPDIGAHRHIFPVDTLEEAARVAASLVTKKRLSPADEGAAQEFAAAELHRRLAPGQQYIRALFSGGTLCYEAQVIWRKLLAAPVRSNAPLDDTLKLSDSTQSQGHTAVDLGEEEFTVGRLHPMIDNELRIRRLLQEARDPQTAVILLDVVIGYGAHPDPAAELAPAIRKARTLASEAGRFIVFVASVTGTEGDPQRLSHQVQQLQEAGALISSSNAAASRLAASIVGAKR